MLAGAFSLKQRSTVVAGLFGRCHRDRLEVPPRGVAGREPFVPEEFRRDRVAYRFSLISGAGGLLYTREFGGTELMSHTLPPISLS